VRISADPGFCWVCRRAGLVPGVLGRFAGVPSGELGRRDLWWTSDGALAARRLMATDDAAIRTAAVDAATPLLPGLASRVTGSHVSRWQEACPTCESDTPTAVQHYRDRLAIESPVLLAGDYLGLPWSDSATLNGRWAADRLITDHTN
jgi:oxygen-dependent protoporphyrinogen oxidase